MIAFPNSRDKYYGEDEVQHKLQILKKSQLRIQENNAVAFLKAKEQFDKRSVERNFEPGDRCYILRPSIESKNVQQKLRPPYDGPYTILEKLSHNNYLVFKDRAKHTLKVHANLIKLVHFKQQQYQDSTEDKEKVDDEYIPPTSPNIIPSTNEEEEARRYNTEKPRRPTRNRTISDPNEEAKKYGGARPKRLIRPRTTSDPMQSSPRADTFRGFPTPSPVSPLRDTPPFPLRQPDFTISTPKQNKRSLKTPTTHTVHTTNDPHKAEFSYTVHTKHKGKRSLLEKAAYEAARAAAAAAAPNTRGRSSTTDVTITATPTLRPPAKPRKLFGMFTRSRPENERYHTRSYTAHTGIQPTTPDLARLRNTQSNRDSEQARSIEDTSDDITAPTQGENVQNNP